MDGTRSALIVANDRYTDPGLRQLRAPASDARALEAVLRNPDIGGFEVRTLLNKPAHEVTLAVENFFSDRRPGDLLLVHFSGHGIKDEDGELYFAAPNTVMGRLGATAVAAEFVSKRMTRSRSRRVVLLLDCCYAGAFERGLVARAGVEMGIEQQFGGRGRAVITASRAMEYAFEAGELADAREVPPSVFTSALVQGLETGEADRDQDGLIGLDELYDHVYDKVRAVTPNQTPGKWTFGVEGELYIARRSHPVTTPVPLPPELVHAIDSPLARIRIGAVQELAGILRGRHAGMALAARLALERLTDDDSRAVAAATTAALGMHAPVPPQHPRPVLALSAKVIDLGRLPQHGQSPEHRVQIGNSGGGNLNARAYTSASWLKLRQTGDEIVVAADSSAAGKHEGTVTVNSDGGTATIRVHARVDPAPLPAIEAAANLPDARVTNDAVSSAQRTQAGLNASPLMLRRRLRAELRTIRQNKGLTQAQAANAIEWSLSKIDRIERAKSSISISDLKALLGLYGITDEQKTEELLALARGARQTPWWKRYSDIAPAELLELIAYESAACAAKQSETTFVPAILQTEEYAQAVLLALYYEKPDVEHVTALVELRTGHRDLLTSENAPEFSFVLDEYVIRRLVGSPSIMSRQLLHLVDTAELPNVTIQLLPFTANLNVRVQGSFEILQFDDTPDENVVFREDRGSNLISDDPKEIEYYLKAFERITENSLSPSYSVGQLRKMANE